jgi:hypothetical protein
MVSKDEVATAKAKRAAPNQRGTIGIQLGKKKEGGLVETDNILLYDYLSECKIMGEGIMNLEFNKGLYHTTLRVKCANSNDRDNLIKLIEEHDKKMWVHTYDPTVMGAVERFQHEISHGSVVQRILSVPEFIIDAVLRLTLFAVDVKDVKKEGRWPLCFCGAMCWLGVFSFLMLTVATQININMPFLPNSFLGITVCAVGTSFPNAVASVIMSSQGKPAAAIANALGSNVQNVFLAMALPWVIYSTQHGFEPLPQAVDGINEGVFWMLATLVLLVLMVLPTNCSLNKVYGYILCSGYLAWVVLTSGETFGLWPRLVN